MLSHLPSYCLCTPNSAGLCLLPVSLTGNSTRAARFLFDCSVLSIENYAWNMISTQICLFSLYLSVIYLIYWKPNEFLHANSHLKISENEEVSTQRAIWIKILVITKLQVRITTRNHYSRVQMVKIWRIHQYPVLEPLELLSNTGTNLCKHFGKQFCSYLKNLIIYGPWNPAIPLWCVHPRGVKPYI